MPSQELARGAGQEGLLPLGRWSSGAPIPKSSSMYLGFLGNVQHELELLRHGQVFLWRLLQSKEKENFH